MNLPQDSPLPYYKTIKTSLKSIVADPYVIERLNTTVLMAHRISIHTLQFLKLYLLHSYNISKELPLVDHALIVNIMKTLAPKQTQRGRPPKDATVELRKELTTFYLQHYQSLMAPEDSPLNCENMSQILEYMAITIETAYLNNVKQHFVTCVERYINVVSDKKSKLDAIKTHKTLNSLQKKDQVAKLSNLLRHIKVDLLTLSSKLTSPPEYHEFISKTRAAILPHKESFEHNSVYYDLQCHPEQYLIGMFRMITEIESKNATIMNLFPLRTSIVPKYIKIDTTILVRLLLDPQKHGYTKSYCAVNIVRLQKSIWALFFKTQKRCFSNQESKRYRFNYMIETDGIGCSIQLTRKDMFGKRHLPQISHLGAHEEYIDEVPIEILQNKRLVAIDPNLSDLLYCVNKTSNQVVKLRYTQNQRRKETKIKKYLRLIEHFKGNTLIESQSVIYWETQLSQVLSGETTSHKTLSFEKFQKYIQHKNQINNKLLTFYEGVLYRKLRLNGYINQQKSEARFLNRFKEIFGPPDVVVIGIGDYEQHQHRKFKEPVKGRGFRRMFRRAGYTNIYLVDEHRTSCRCHNCKDVISDNKIVGGACVTFKRCQNPRPWRKEEQILRHGLLLCQTCQKLWCRDTHASLNIWEITNAAKEGQPRPKYLQRGRVLISSATSALPTEL